MDTESDTDPFALDRFVEAQTVCYETALAEIQQGQKVSHWMWFIFPQFAGLGSSPAAQEFAIKSLDEARAYLAHAVLGPRLIECTEALLAMEGRMAHDIFGSPDDLKLRSSATLFAAVSGEGSLFQRVLEKYFQGEPDERTLQLSGLKAGQN